MQTLLRHRTFSLLALIGLLVGLGAIAEDQAGPQPGRSSSRLAFTSRVSAASAPSTNLDTVADEVFGQPDFTNNAVLNPPSAASLTAPNSVVIDVDTGRMFVADTANNRVLSWASVDTYQVGDPADVILGQPDETGNSANAGGLSASSLNQPGAVTYDAEDETLFVADTGNNRVLVYASPFSTHMAASEVIGQPNSTSNTALPANADTLNMPAGLTIDNVGNLIVADRNNHRVMGFEPPFATGMEAIYLIGQPRNPDQSLNFTSTLAPNPPSAASLNQPSAVAVSPNRDRLYVVDSGDNRILAYDLSSADEFPEMVFGQPNFTSNATPAQPSASNLSNPTGVAVDSADRLYVADTNHNRVLVYSDPAHSAVADHVFGQPNFTTGTAASPPTESSLFAPRAITPDGIIGIYIVDQGNNRVLAYDQPLPNITPRNVMLEPGTIRAGTGATTLEVTGVGFITTSKVLINGVERATTFKDDTLLTVALSAAEVAAAGALNVAVMTPAPGGGTSAALTLAVYAPGPLDGVADRVLGQRDFVHTGSYFIPAEANNLAGPTGVAVNQQSGRMFVADNNNLRVLSWPSASSFADGQAADLVIGQPDLISSIGWPEAFGGPGISASGIGQPYGVAVDGQGNLYVADSDSNRVLVFTPPLSTGMAATKVIGQPDFTTDTKPTIPSASNLSRPAGLLVGPDGTLYIADTGHNRVLAYLNPLTTDAVADHVFGQSSFTAGDPNPNGISASSLDEPGDMVLDNAGSLYLADYGNNRVLMYTNPLNGDQTADKVFGQTEFTTAISATSAVGLYGPIGLTMDAQGTLYVSDTDNNRILAYASASSGDTTADLVIGQNGSFTGNTPNAGGVSALSLNAPTGLARDPSGDLLVADYFNARVLAYKAPLLATAKLYLPLLMR